jgi:hypothetical protein
VRGPTGTRFRTIQVCPKDLRLALRQAERAVIRRDREGYGIGEVPMLDTKRREFIALVGGGGLLLAVKMRRARAQPSSMPLIGLLHSTSPEAIPSTLGLHRGLAEIGYLEGQNFVFEYRWVDGQYDRFPALLTDLVAGVRSIWVNLLPDNYTERATTSAR